VIAAFVVFFAERDDEVAVFDVGVFAMVGVGLELVVAPAVASEVVGPLFGVGGGAVGAVEFVGPGEGVILGGGELRGIRFGLRRGVLAERRRGIGRAAR
jgi:hypothetical protein